MTKKDNLKVLLITPIYPPEIGGPATYTKEIVPLLEKRGHHVRIIALNGKKADNNVIIIHEKNFILRIAKLFVEIIRQIKSFKPNVILSLDPLSSSLPAIVPAKIFGVKIVLRFVGDIAWEKARREKKIEYNLTEFLHRKTNKHILLLQSIVVRGYDRVYTCSKFMKEYLTKMYHIPNNKVKVIYNFSIIPPIKNRSRRKQIITVCRLIPLKRVDRIIAVKKGIPDINYLIVGSGPEEENLKALSGKDKRIVFLGRKNQSEVLELIARSKALVLYSQHEGLPKVVLESLYLGTPVILSNIPPHKEIYDRMKGIGVYLCRNEQELLEKIKLVTRKKEDYKKISEKAKEVFSWKKHLEDLEKLLS